MSVNKYRLLQPKLNDLTISLPIKMDFDIVGHQDTINSYGEEVLTNSINAIVDYEVVRFTHKGLNEGFPDPSKTPTPTPTPSSTVTPTPSVTVTPTPSRTINATPTQTPTNTVTPTPTPTCNNNFCVCHSVIANTFGGACTTTYYNCAGNVDSITILESENGLVFNICVRKDLGNDGIISNGCGFNMILPECGCNCTNQSCENCDIAPTPTPTPTNTVTPTPSRTINVTPTMTPTNTLTPTPTPTITPSGLMYYSSNNLIGFNQNC